MKQLPTAIGNLWLLSFVACVAAVILSLPEYADYGRCCLLSSPSGRASQHAGRRFRWQYHHFRERRSFWHASLYARLVNGRLPPLAEALALACLASICAYTIDSEVLKVYFGVPNPYQMTRSGQRTCTITGWEGSPYSRFPRPATWRWLEPLLAFSWDFIGPAFVGRSLALLLSCILLIIGGWHFLSDVIAGTYFGVSVGLAVLRRPWVCLKEGRTTDASLWKANAAAPSRWPR